MTDQPEPEPDTHGCHVIEVDGEPVRVQAADDMPAEVRAALEDVIRAVQANHPAITEGTDQ